ncbi:Branched-chain-amino-acid aminotransferase 6 [Glycine max]|nr:Branched-chain-amino-acid aminotransferase 6 [Glycine max]
MWSEPCVLVIFLLHIFNIKGLHQGASLHQILNTCLSLSLPLPISEAILVHFVFLSSLYLPQQDSYKVRSGFHTTLRKSRESVIANKTMSPPSMLGNRKDGSEIAVAENYADINWDELGFSLVPTDYMYVMKCAKGDKFSQGSIVPFGNIEISPSAGILNYGQGLFEGLKAHRTEDGHVPPSGKGSLYVRPLLMGTGASLGVGPAPEYTFLIYCSPVGSYHKGALNFKVEDKLYRAISGSGGTGGIKSVTNYAPVYTAMTEAKANGFSDVLFLDSATGKYIEEATACNDNSIFTPEIDGTILPGITRKSIIEIAIDLGYQVMERAVSVEEMLGADEMFCTGTAMVVNSVASVTYKETRVDYKTGPEALSAKLRATLVGIQTGCVEDKKSWTVLVD